MFIKTCCNTKPNEKVSIVNLKKNWTFLEYKNYVKGLFPNKLHIFFVFSETISASEPIEESKLSILNKENQNIKANGYLYLTFIFWWF